MYDPECTQAGEHLEGLGALGQSVEGCVDFDSSGLGLGVRDTGLARTPFRGTGTWAALQTSGKLFRGAVVPHDFPEDLLLKLRAGGRGAESLTCER